MGILYFVAYILIGILVAYATTRVLDLEDEWMRNLMLVLAWPMPAVLLFIAGMDVGLSALFSYFDDRLGVNSDE